MAEHTPQQPPKPPGEDSSYGYGYGSYGYYGNYPQYNGNYYSNRGYYGSGSYGGYSEGYGYRDQHPGAHEGSAMRIFTFKDYLLMIRERFYYLLLAIVIVTSVFVLANIQRQDEYQAMAKLRIHRRAQTTPGVGGTPDADVIASDQDFYTLVEMMKDSAISTRVLRRLDSKTKEAVLNPYQKGNIFTGPLRALDVLDNCRTITPVRGTLIVTVAYRHPEASIATLLAQYFAEEIQDSNNSSRRKIVMPMLETTEVVLKTLETEIDALFNQRSEMLKKNPKLLNLDSLMNLASSEMHSLNNALLAAESTYLAQKRNWDRMNTLKKEGKPLTDMDMIASADRVGPLRNDIMRLNISIETSKLRYGPEHRTMKGLYTSHAETQKELDRAINDAVNRINESFYRAEADFKAAEKRAEAKRLEIADLYQQQSEVTRIARKMQEKQSQKSSIDVTFYADKIKASGGMISNIDILEKSTLISTRPVNKDYWRWGVLGMFAGAILGLLIIFALAFLDDRVKSAADIEGFLGLPLVGILPIARRSSTFDKARLVEGSRDRPAKEAFLSVYSALRINDAARNSRTFLITSTSPSEGKSFVATNLALTYAMHGERVLLIDADLRMPVVAKTLQLSGEQGITQYFQGKVPLEDAIHYGVATNFDVLPVGAPCSNPTQILSSRKFAEMISTVKACYDRVIIDSPPIGAVSDALNLVSLADGVLYVVRFNTVKKRFIRSNIARLRESKVPIFGAILNQIGMSVVRYYTNTGERSSNRYYSRVSKNAVNVTIPSE